MSFLKKLKMQLNSICYLKLLAIKINVDYFKAYLVFYLLPLIDSLISMPHQDSAKYFYNIIKYLNNYIKQQKHETKETSALMS